MAYYGPDEDSTTIFFERSFLAAMFVIGVGYGMQFILYVVCARYLWNERAKRGRMMIILLAYITLLFSLSSLWASVATWTEEDMYINNRNYPGGPLGYFLATQDLPENVIFIVMMFVLTFLSDLLVIWRCWVIWTSSTAKPLAYVVVAFPFLMLVASLALGIVWLLQSTLPGLTPYSQTPLVFGTSYYTISLGVNIVVTILITLRLALYRRVMLETLPAEHASPYLSVMSIFIESAALYSVIALIFIITYALNNPINQIILGMSPASQQIAGYLIILRIARGQAWGDDTLIATTSANPQLSALQFHDPTTIDQSDLESRPNQRMLKPEP